MDKFSSRMRGIKSLYKIDRWIERFDIDSGSRRVQWIGRRPEWISVVRAIDSVKRSTITVGGETRLGDRMQTDWLLGGGSADRVLAGI